MIDISFEEKIEEVRIIVPNSFSEQASKFNLR